MLRYIKLHGKYPTFLDLFYLIIAESNYKSLHKEIMQAILSIDHDDISPFSESHCTLERFY